MVNVSVTRFSIYFSAIFILTAFTIFPSYRIMAQVSIHREQSEYYRSLGLKSVARFDSLNDFTPMRIPADDTCSLRKMVFGYHPYWAGSQYLNYRWNLLSDLCFFSYEVDPATGNATTTHDWETATVIDTAQAHGTRVHLCITSFRSHQLFFSNPQAQQQLISNTISLLKLRNADGVNLDFEAVPSSLSAYYNDFLVAFADSLHASIPGCLVSMASPAVDWDYDLDMPELSEHLDFFMIMAYDYYWNGSSTAGPVAGMFPMTGSYNYSVARTVSWYLSRGVPREKMVLGLPYYGRDWPTVKEYAPSAASGGGSALTYRQIRNNYAGHYSDNYLHFEPNSFANYYSYRTDGWHQCFLDDVHSFNRYYNLVNRFGLKGIGIWALGYDDGRAELWDMIRDKLTGCAFAVCEDSLYDAGGPAFGYENNEDYRFTVAVKPGDDIFLEFDQVSMDDSNDTLFVYDGPDDSSPLINTFVAGTVAGPVHSAGNAVSFHFKSDDAGTGGGWKIHYRCPSAGIDHICSLDQASVFPNPFSAGFTLSLSSRACGEFYCTIFDGSGRKAINRRSLNFTPGNNSYPFFDKALSALPPGIYLMSIVFGNGRSQVVKLLKQ